MIDYLRAGLAKALDENAVAAALATHCGLPRAELDALGAQLQPFLAGIVDAVDFMMRASKDPQVGRAVAFANGQVLHYLLDDQDLLPEAQFGVLGLLDDALLVHGYASLVLAWYPSLAARAAPYAVPAPHAFELVRALLPAGIADAIERTSRSVLTVAAAMAGTPSAGGASPPHVELRVADARALV